MTVDRLTYVEKYDDGSGVEFQIEYINKPYLHDKSIKGVINITHVDTVLFPITKIDWLIERLQRIKNEAV